MILNSLIFGGITGIWWALVWFVLPVDLRQLSVPSLTLLHVAPPVLLMGAWSAWKSYRAKRAAALAQAAIDAQAAENAARISAARDTHEAELRRRRAYVDCRGVWVSSTTPPPGWFEGQPAPCAFLEHPAEETLGVGRETALRQSLHEVLSLAIGSSPAIAWLPIYLLPGNQMAGAAQLDLARGAWQAAIDDNALDHPPGQADCKFLPGIDGVADRVVALFENDPTLPALLLLGPDSPLADTEADDPYDDDAPPAPSASGKPGHAVVALLFSRPGLTTSYRDDDAVVTGDDQDPYQPYWERQGGEAAGLGWARVPPPLQPALLDLAPLATLHQGRTLQKQGGVGHGNGLSRQIQNLLEGALINASLRDQPFDSAEADAPAPVEIGWLAHNSGSVDTGGSRLAALATALHYFGSELNPIDQATNVVVEYGDIGAARGPLLLATALLRAAQLAQPTVAAEFDGDDFVGVGVMRPAIAGATP
ncbi:hypothetical protein [Chitiniphilus eburneus]|uniref:DUF2875 domain-containing protein n=1 Tax=Chitiniphilus eburneus TaxID=2571148 RepID=A0A4U0PI65_9NEIS|nr:hypothetical protein [Chitiniphilus eburneus]TJZ66842.1 hypothetical protein FAZ21_16800 [Chitiniphilus eburneus]